MLESLNTDVFEYEKLKPEEMQQRGILGRLVGIMADTVNPTRNGRSYSSKLWDNVFNNPIMKERIENNCCFGELGHPLDREETDMTKIAICMDGLPKKDKDGKLQAVFNILDTPNGRILKTLCDYGCNIGISSRGSGDLVTDFDGNESVDPDTYNCEGWDAVIIPAVKEARLKYVTESLDKKRYNKTLREKLTESIKKETDENREKVLQSLKDCGITLDYSDKDNWESVGFEVATPEETAKAFNININEDANKDISKDDIEVPEEESKNENDFFYKGIEILKDPDTGKFVCSLDGDSYSFNSEKNAKLWIDINSKGKIGKDTLIKDLATNTQRDIEKSLSKVIDSDSEIQKVMRGKLSDLSKFIDVKKYLTEEQVGRDEVKDDKNVDDVLKPEAEEDSEEKEKDKNKVTVTITESIDWTELNGTEQSSVEAVANKLENGEYRYLDDIELDCESAVRMYDEANAFAEYEDEDFYMEEGDPRKVYEYIINAPHYKKYIDKLVPYGSKSLTESTNIFSVEYTYDEETDDSFETFYGHINVKASSEKEALEKAEKYITSTEFMNKHDYISNPRHFRISNSTYSNVDLVEDLDLDVDNIEAEIDSLQEMLRYNKTLEKQIIELNEKLSVSYAKEKSLKQELKESKEKISTLSKISKDNKILTEKLNAANDSAVKLNESKEKNISRIKSLKEKLNSVTKERDSSDAELTTLREDYEILTRDLNQTKEQFSKKFEKQNKLLEKYQKITKSAVDRYISMQATNLGVKPVEIKNRLSESFSFNDIDSVCEDLRNYKLNVSKLPFSTNQLNEGISVKATNIGRDSLIPRNEVDELTDYDLKLMEAYL